MGLLVKYLSAGRIFLPQDVINFIDDLQEILLLDGFFLNPGTPHQIEDPFSHRRKIDIEDGESPIEIEDDRFDRVKWTHKFKCHHSNVN
jgi:hypothetical protein